MLRAFWEFWRRYRKKRRKTRASFDIDKFEGILSQSSVPGITLLVMVWAVCALFLTLAVSRQRDANWKIGDISTVTLWARCAFEYEDIEATAEKRADAQKKATLYFRIDPKKSRQLEEKFTDFLDAVIQRNAGKEVDFSSAGNLAARNASTELIKYVAPRNEDFKTRALRAINRGIISDALLRQYNNPERAVKIEDLYGNTNHYQLTLADCRTPEAAVKEIFFAEEKIELFNEFRQIISSVFDSDGNLVPDPDKIAAAEKAAVVVEPVMRRVEEKDLLLEKGTVITDAIRKKLDAERKQLPRDFEYNMLIINLICGLSLLAVVLIYLVILRPRIIRQPREMAVASIVIAASLWVNYLVVVNFSELHFLPQLIVCAVPITLPMVLLSVTLGLRAAFCCGFLTATVTTLMVSSTAHPQLSLAVRWLFIGGVSALIVHRVVSYRSFFIRTFLASTILNLLFNLDILYQTQGWGIAELKEIGSVIVLTGFLCAILALVMIFFLELLFNLDTNMALTVLANLNHPLLERLKREAPGTMFHSITVATLAEDAAIAIGANALRAKVGALFHDIGKLAMPQYFTENNRGGNKHLLLAPRISSLIIRDHVTKGLEFARQYRLFRYIRDAIATHHGDDLTRYFYLLALKKQRDAGEPESSVLEAEYRYDGPPPDLKELAIISLADACEAASRSLPNPSEPRIREMVEKIIGDRLKNGQLRKAELTLAELDAIKNCFIKTLVNINHGRIAYNVEEKDGASRDGVATAVVAEAGK
ncbi:MAG: HDIG domain-containing protein [Victivallaceae bacterium]|nr:HDIG domain-containing protein [Victivallaceae bacterium]